MDDATRDLVARALAEDIGVGDVTSEAIVPADASGRARIVQKAPGVIFGLDVAAEVFRQAGADDFDRLQAEGKWRDAAPGDVALVAGSARALLAGERVALNLLGHLSGIATLTAQFVAEVRGSSARILDTRKTTPGLRALEKAAVAAGGGANHRMGLYDAVLVKENHVAIAGGVGEAVRRAREGAAGLPVEIECRSLDEVAAALNAGAARLLLDNMSLEDLALAIAQRDSSPPAGGSSSRPPAA